MTGDRGPAIPRSFPAPAQGLEASRLRWLGALLLLTILRLAVAAATPLSPDESYYWVWSRALAPGYLDHPPMVALWIRGGTALLGPDPLGIRLLAPIGAALGSVLLYRAARDLPEPVSDPAEAHRRGVVAAALLNSTLLLGIGSVIITPDTPLLVFVTAAWWALGRALRSGHTGWWLLCGFLLGLALDSKYTAALPGAGFAAWLLLSRPGRRWMRVPGPWLAGAAALLSFMPVVWWNATHGWASFLKQGGRSDDWHPARAAQFLGELMGGQLGLATPLLFLMLVAGMAEALRRARRPGADGGGGWSLCCWLVLLPVAVFLQHALGGRVQANWPGLIYPAAMLPTAAVAAQVRWGRFWPQAAGLGAAMTLLVYAQSATALLPLPRKLDVTLQRLGGWTDLATAAASRTDGFLVADEYGLASELAHALPGRAVFGMEPRWRLFSLPHGLPPPSEEGLLVRSARRNEPPDPQPWSELEPAGELVRARDGREAERYRLFRVRFRALPTDTAVARLP
ncbi:glycosyltransferase family 39 protein [Rhizosaccharibacter radicis]|uniref:Glycosyltransferase family 39 protein n=1 Tax=Rhizosaccharibacter radicis TaxID=2782605 RepID=A0ABT1VUR7_9PROT|nr:glycosyltransferase family 39 protein [Acetobacteraceae bacterium KSS12]